MRCQLAGGRSHPFPAAGCPATQGLAAWEEGPFRVLWGWGCGRVASVTLSHFQRGFLQSHKTKAKLKVSNPTAHQ